MNRADADERAGRRQPLGVRVDGRHHGADAIGLSRAHDRDQRELVLGDDILAERRRQPIRVRWDLIARLERNGDGAVVEADARVAPISAAAGDSG